MLSVVNNNQPIVNLLCPQVSIQTPCCKRWYECPECHDERENHPQLVETIVVSLLCAAPPPRSSPSYTTMAMHDVECTAPPLHEHGERAR